MVMSISSDANFLVEQMDPKITWLHMAPLTDRVAYPIVLDLAEAALSAVNREEIYSISQTLALTWEELAEHKVDLLMNKGPSWYDTDKEDDDTNERFLVSSFAKILASLGPRFGVILHNPQWFDITSLYFLQRLSIDARNYGLNIAVQVDPRYLSSTLIRDLFSDYQTTRIKHDQYTVIDLSHPLTQFLAVFSHGVPIEVIQELGLQILEKDCSVKFSQGHQKWLYLPSFARKRVLDQMSAQQQQNIRTMLYDAWKPKLWGYLRRANLAITAKNMERVFSQHSRYVHGSDMIGRYFLYDQFDALCNYPQMEQSHKFAAEVGAARLSSRLFGVKGYKTGIKHYKKALSFSMPASIKAALSYELGNLHATQRTQKSLVEARKVYSLGFQYMQNIEDLILRSQAEITLKNGLALVEYHEQSNDAALRLENEAISIAQNMVNVPQLYEWAVSLLHVNTAKLMLKRFDDPVTAIKLLETVREFGKPEARERCALDLARVYFDQGNYTRILDILHPYYESGNPIALNENREILGRVLFTIALIVTGKFQRAELQLKRLRYLSEGINSPNLQSIIHEFDKIAKKY